MGWIGVDFDGTLAEYGHKQWPAIGKPIGPMVRRVKQWLLEGREVRIVTARVCSIQTLAVIKSETLAIERWCEEHLGQRLVVTAEKDFSMIVLYDDRAVRVMSNSGDIVGDEFDFHNLAS